MRSISIHTDASQNERGGESKRCFDGITWLTVILRVRELSFMAFGEDERLAMGEVGLERPESREGMLSKTISATWVRRAVPSWTQQRRKPVLLGTRVICRRQYNKFACS